jgi:hypothetical protein
MLGPPKVRSLDQPALVSLEALVPAGHFYRHLDAEPGRCAASGRGPRTRLSRRPTPIQQRSRWLWSVSRAVPPVRGS